MAFEPARAFGDESRVVEGAGKLEKAFLEFVDRQGVGLEIDVEQGAALGGLLCKLRSYVPLLNTIKISAHYYEYYVSTTVSVSKY